jgi:tetratricopeptide (TPR) repeat protein
MDKPLSLELVPMEESASGAGPEPATSPPPAAAVVPQTADAIEIRPLERPVPLRNGGGNTDGYAAQAAREFAEGTIEQPLWERALKQANGDETAAAAIYVRARAVALRLFDRDRAPRTPPRVQGPAIVEDDEDELRRPAARRETVWTQYRYAIIAVGLAVPIAIAAAVWMFGRSSSPPPSAVTAKAPAQAAPAGKPEAPTVVPTDFAKKVQELRDAGNFNVLVLYAVEWTRKEPQNPAAWDNLRMGYLYLRQYEDALSAATKASQLAPDDARLWRQLGLVNLELDDPSAALNAFEQAAARNSADLDSLHQVALLNARLGRPQEAKAAFDRAAAASPGDAVTACLRNGVAQMPAARDAYTMSRQIRAFDDHCHGREEAAAKK